ncbi:MAG: FAD-dependent oxidoreductase [Candidatus Bathyarchaeia archaeon]
MGQGVYDLVIVGSGPAGLTAGLYAGRARIRTLIVEKSAIGGELMNRDLLENFPGYPEGIYGPELAGKLVKQVQKLGIELQIAEALRLKVEDKWKVIETTQGNFISKSVIVATGTSYKKLGIEEEFINKGVFYCATCDGPAFIGKNVVVVGGGDSGVTEAIFMAKIGVNVTIIEQKPKLTAQKYLQDKLHMTNNITVKCNTKVEKIIGKDEVEAVELVNLVTGHREVIAAQGVCVRIGTVPNSQFVAGLLELDADGKIIVNQLMETNVPMIFAVGDVRANSVGQIVAAMGDGAIAGMRVQHMLDL